MAMTFWWPVTDEEWERLNYPEKFQPKNNIHTKEILCLPLIFI
jgi:hypothetical protein